MNDKPMPHEEHLLGCMYLVLSAILAALVVIALVLVSLL